MTLQVHDELVIECPENQADKVSALMKEVMENAAQLNVSLTVDIGRGANWFEAHAL